VTVWPRPGRGNRSSPSPQSNRYRRKRSKSPPIPAAPSRRAEPHTGREGPTAPTTKQACKPHAPRPPATRWQQSSPPSHDWGAAGSRSPSTPQRQSVPSRTNATGVPTGQRLAHLPWLPNLTRGIWTCYLTFGKGAGTSPEQPCGDERGQCGGGNLGHVAGISAIE
jgi:hypothetical protein